MGGGHSVPPMDEICALEKHNFKKIFSSLKSLRSKNSAGTKASEVSGFVFSLLGLFVMPPPAKVLKF